MRRPPVLPARVRARRPRPVSRRLAVLSLLLAVAIGVAAPGPLPDWWAVPAIIGGGAISLALLATSFPGRPTWSAACFPLAAGAGLAVEPGAWVAPCIGVTFLAHSLVTGRPRTRLFAEVARLTSGATIGASLAGVLVWLGSPAPAAAAGGILVMWGVTHLLAGFEVAATTGRPLGGLLRTRARDGLVTNLSAGGLGIGAGVLLADGLAGMPAVLVPAVLVWVTGREDARRAAGARASVELARLRQGTDDGSVGSDAAARALVTAVARLVGGADVQLLVVAVEGPVSYQGDEGGRIVRERVAPQAFDEPLIVRALAVSAPVITMGAGDRPTAALGLRTAGAGGAGAIVVRRPAGAAPFARAERTLLAAVRDQAGTWLQPRGAQGDGILFTPKPATPDVPLMAVREAALRLARAAQDEGQAPDEPSLARVVDELHVVERSVAALLGGAVPDNAEDIGAQEWTTSGTFEARR